MSARQKAIVRKNLARRCKPTPSSYSIDRSFKRTRRKSSSVSAASDVDGHSSSSERGSSSGRRAKHRHPKGASASPDKKRARVDDGTTLIDLDSIIDCSRISKYFCLPVPMIEPIDDLDEADIAEIVEPTVPENPQIDANESTPGPSSILIQDLFGTDSGSDDESDDPQFQPMDTDSDAMAHNEHTAQPFDVIPDRVPSPEPDAQSYESDDSPASPPPPPQFDDDDDAVTPTIPAETVVPCTKSAFHQALSDYSHDKLKFLRQHGKPIDAADPQRYARLHRIALCYLNDDLFTAATVDECCDRLLAVSDSRRWLAAVMRELVEDIDAAEPLDMLNTPPAPPLTHSHQRLVLLVTRLDAELPGFLAYCQLVVEQTLFTFGSVQQKPATASLVNLVRYHVALADLRPATDTGSLRTRLFIYKCLYYFQHVATPLVYVVLQANPQCLPVLRPDHDEQTPAPEALEPDAFPEPPPRPAAFDDLDPIVQTLHVVLQNTNYVDKMTVDAQLYKKAEMLRLLRQHYKFDTAQRRSYADLLERMLQRIRDGRLRNVAEALILVGKRCGCDWTRRHLLDETVLPQMLRGYVRQWTDVGADDDAAAEPRLDERVACLLHTIGSLVKPFPVTEDVTALQDLFGSVLAAAVGRPVVQEAAVSALLQTARFGAINVYRRVCDWQPEVAIGQRVALQLQTFVHRKPQTFWS